MARKKTAKKKASKKERASKGATKTKRSTEGLQGPGATGETALLASPLLMKRLPEGACAAQATPDQLQGRYMNLVHVKHTSREFVFDFFLRLESHAVMVSRLITSPPHAKAVCRALQNNIEKYEKKFGEIEDVE